MEAESYSVLPFHGYINSSHSEGFKTPVFKNGGCEMLQLVDRRDIVIGFSELEIDPDAPIVKPNQPVGDIYTYVGQPAVHFFKPAMGRPIVGQRRVVIGKLRQWLRSEDDVDPSVAIDVLSFVGASPARIDEAIEALGQWHVRETGLRDEKYIQRLRRVTHRRLRELDERYSVTDPTVKRHIDDSELASTFREQVQASTGRQANFLREVESHYEAAKSLLNLPDKSLRAAGRRKLFAAAAVSELVDTRQNPARTLMRLTLATTIWSQVKQHNRDQLDRAASSNVIYPYNSLSIPKLVIDKLVTCEATEVLVTLVELISELPPTFGSQRRVPIGSLHAGRVVGVDSSCLTLNVKDTDFRVDQNLLSVQRYHNAPDYGECVLFSVRKNNNGSIRGKPFVPDAFSLFFPPSDQADGWSCQLGASNSWAVIRMTKEEKHLAIAGRGIYLQSMTETLGLRRVTVFEADAESQENELGDFVKSSFSTLSLSMLGPKAFRLTWNLEEASLFDERKVRTFMSMLRKLFPDCEFQFFVRDEASNLESAWTPSSRN